MISPLGIAFALAAIAVLVLRSDQFSWVLAAAVPFTATAALTLFGQSIVIYPLLAIVLIFFAIRGPGIKKLFTHRLTGKVGLGVLILLGIWSAMATLVGPIMFAGTPVLDPKRGIDDGVAAPAELAFKLTNVVQLGYLWIGICTVIAIGTRRRISPHLPAIAFGVGTVVSSLRYLLPTAAQTALIDTSQNVSYTTGEFNGVERLRGVFSEPSALGSFSAAAAVFFLIAAGTLGPKTKLLYSVLGLWALTNTVLSFSGGALATTLVVLALLLAKAVATTVVGQKPLKPVFVLGALALPLLWLVYGGTVSTFVSSMFSDKAGSSSYENRSAADQFSFGLVDDTYGVGTGLGSNRPSSFIASLVSTVGVVGVVLFTVAFLVIVWSAAASADFKPTVWALITIVVAKIIAGPDVSEPPLWFLLGVCAFAAWSRKSVQNPEVNEGTHELEAIR